MKHLKTYESFGLGSTITDILLDLSDGEFFVSVNHNPKTEFIKDSGLDKMLEISYQYDISIKRDDLKEFSHDEVISSKCVEHLIRYMESNGYEFHISLFKNEIVLYFSGK